MSESSGSGCLKAFFIVLGLILLLVVLGGYLLYRHAPDLMRSGGATLIEAGADNMLSELHYSPEEKERVMEPIRAFAKDVREGRVDMQQAARVAEALGKGGAMTAIALEAFRVTYLTRSGLSDEEKESGKVALSRFIEGTATGRISSDQAKALLEIVTVKETGSGGDEKPKFKEKLSDAEVRSFLATAKRSADEANIEDRYFPIDLRRQVESAIRKGKAQSVDEPHADTLFRHGPLRVFPAFA